VTPDLKQYDAACGNYFHKWATYSDVLYGMCRRYPDHADPGHINAKVGIIGRSFATRIESKVKSSGGQGSALATGLRASELRSLTPSSFDLRDLGKARVAVEAAYSKHRRRDVLPIRRDLAEAIARFTEGRPPAEPLFPDLPQRTAEMLRVDLDNAKPWIPYCDAAGRRVDFHSLRTTYITRLARAGVPPAVAKELARHSTITLTIDHYTDVAEGDERAALDRLPALPQAPEPTADPRRATGTEG
jgi:integrase